MLATLAGCVLRYEPCMERRLESPLGKEKIIAHILLDIFKIIHPDQVSSLPGSCSYIYVPLYPLPLFLGNATLVDVCKDCFDFGILA